MRVRTRSGKYRQENKRINEDVREKEKNMVQLRIISDQQHALPVIQSAIAAKVKRIEIGLRKTEQEIQKFESKYHLSSEQFMTDCTAEDLDGGDDEYVTWMGELQLREAIREELHLLSNIEYVTQRVSD
jgi:hypothetical protein